MRIIKGPSGEYLVGNVRTAYVPYSAWSGEGARAAVIAHYRDIVDSVPTTEINRLYGLTLLTSTDCNLACPYCFQNTTETTGETIADRITTTNLNSTVIDAVATFVKAQCQRYGYDGLELLLFGGEPLLRFEACLEVLDKLADAPLLAAGVHTNGTLLTPTRAEQLASRGVSKVHITFDGSRDFHDSSRYNKQRRGTYDLLLKNLGRVAQRTDFVWTIRVNVDLASVGSIDPLIEDLRTRLPLEQTTIYLAPILDFGLNDRENILAAAQIEPELAKAIYAIHDAGFRMPQTGAGGCVFCGAIGGEGGAVVGPDGRLFSCWETAGKDEFEVGNVFDGYLSDADVVAARWQHCGQGALGVTDGRDLSAQVLSTMELAWFERARSRHMAGTA